jgi:fumarate reductase subunit C
MGASELIRATSRVLNKVLFGSSVASDDNIGSQWGTIGTAYVFNLLMIFVIVAAIGTVAGYYKPLDAPFANPTLRVLLALSNIVTFALTYVASITWEMHEKAIEIQRAARRVPGEIVVLIALFSIPSLFLLAALFLTLDIGALIASALVNAALLQMLTSERIFKSKDQE